MSISYKADGNGNAKIDFVGSEDEILQSCCSIVHATMQQLSGGNPIKFELLREMFINVIRDDIKMDDIEMRDLGTN